MFLHLFLFVEKYMTEEIKDKNYKAFKEGTLTYWLFVSDTKLSSQGLKEHFDDIDWRRVPRKLGPNHKEFFYIGTYNDDERKIKLTLRPSGRVQIMESLLEILKDRSSYVNHGITVEVLISDEIRNKIKEASKEPDKHKIDTISWD